MIRFYSSFDQIPLNTAAIKNKVHDLFNPENDKPPSQQDTIDALRACSKLEALFADSSNPGSSLTETPVQEARDIVDMILASKKSVINLSVLKEVFMSSPAPSNYSSIQMITAFNDRNPKEVIPLQTSLIPFRRAAYSAQFDDALKLMDLTFGDESHHKLYIRRKIQKYFGMWTLGVGGTLSAFSGLFHSGWIGQWSDINMIITAIGTYFTTTSFYAYLAFSGRISGSGEVLEWIKGTPINRRYANATQLKMASILARVNRDLPENQGELSLHLIKELAKRDMKPVETEDDEMMREYWATAGAGFEWCEPDQDPAEMIFNHQMNAERAKRIGQPYSRNEPDPRDQEVLKTLPHASLIDLPDQNSLPDGPANPSLPGSH